jgi:hypothetical protein
MSQIVLKPWWFLIGGNNMCVTLFGHIWVPKSMWPNPPSCLIEHEKIHLRQQAEVGWTKWIWRYLTSRKWRLNYEAEGYALQAKLCPEDYPYAINVLCGWKYFWAARSLEEAKAAVDTYMSRL